jgi:hypothetical protein
MFILIEISHGTSQSFQTNARIAPWLGHDYFLPNIFQFISYPTMWCYITYILTVSLNKPLKVRALSDHSPQAYAEIKKNIRNFIFTTSCIFRAWFMNTGSVYLF